MEWVRQDSVTMVLRWSPGTIVETASDPRNPDQFYRSRSKEPRIIIFRSNPYLSENTS